MQSVECSVGNSFVVEHGRGEARITVVSIERNEVTLGIEDSSQPARGYQEVTIPAENNDVLELLRTRGR